MALQNSALFMTLESKSLFNLVRMTLQLGSLSFSKEACSTASFKAALYAAMSSSRDNSALRFLPEVGVVFFAEEDFEVALSLSAATSASLSLTILSVNWGWAVTK